MLKEQHRHRLVAGSPRAVGRDRGTECRGQGTCRPAIEIQLQLSGHMLLCIVVVGLQKDSCLLVAQPVSKAPAVWGCMVPETGCCPGLSASVSF